MADCSRTVEEVKSLMKSCRGSNPQQVAEHFTRWAPTYEQDIKKLNYGPVSLAVDFLNSKFCGKREEAQVLDVACGSGLVAKTMVELGFRHFVGVDCSQGMLDEAAKTGLYQDLRLALLGTQRLPAETGAFDVVIITGSLHEDYVPVSVIRELCDAIKPGGYACMTAVDRKSEKGDKYRASLQRELQLMVEEGLWTHVSTEVIKEYMHDIYNDHDDKQSEHWLQGTLYLYRKSLN
ncbi:methyltransferase-like protein 27 [Pagrus major]|uniref:methyltransferase-like protein 27 n=1 Tax=Pagrus major TaxID=143350 RepID=UPI003CC8924E